MAATAGNPGSEIGQRIRALVAEQLGIDAGEVGDDANLLDDLGADSLDVVELIMALEDEFDIEVPDDAAEQIRTIADVERYVAEHVT